MRVEMYQELPEESVQIRTDVFMKEQGFKEEFDETDDKATHIIIYEANVAVATCRFFYDHKKEMYVLGRIAVLKMYRGKNYGAELVKAAEREIITRGYRKCGLSAQERAMGFYKKLEYNQMGNSYLDEGCPHVWMEKEL